MADERQAKILENARATRWKRLEAEADPAGNMSPEDRRTAAQALHREHLAAAGRKGRARQTELLKTATVTARRLEEIEALAQRLIRLVDELKAATPAHAERGAAS